MPSPITQQNNNIMQGYASNAIFIRGGREGAKNYPVAAGYTAFLVDEENKKFFIKTNDTSGIPRQLREFDWEEVTPADLGSFDPSKFATKDDFNVLLEEIKKLQPQRENNYHNKQRRNNNVQSDD